LTLPLPPLPMEKLSFKSFSILWDVFTIFFYFLSAIYTPAIPRSNPLSTTILLLRSSSLSHHHLPHLAMNSTLALQPWFGSDPSLEKLMIPMSIWKNSRNCVWAW
jgi:hypothetical protein